MASNAFQSHQYMVRVPGARRIKILQQKAGLINGQYVRRYERIKDSNVNPLADPAKYVTVSTKKGLSGSFHWKDQFKVTATFGTGKNENTKTWQFRVTKSKSMTLRCAACVEKANKIYTPPGFVANKAGANGKAAGGADPRGVFTTGSAVDPNNVIGGLATVGMSMVPGAAGTGDVVDTGTSVSDSSVTDQAGEGDVEVLSVDANGSGTPEQVSEEIENLVDEGAVVEIEESTEDALAPVEYAPALVEALPFDVPPAVEPYVVPAAGALVGGIAGRFILDRAAVGAIAGGLAGFFLGNRR